MSDRVWNFTFKPLTGTFDLERQIKIQSGGSGGTGGTVSSGNLTFPGGVTFEIRDGIAMTGESEITLLANSEILVTT